MGEDPSAAEENKVSHTHLHYWYKYKSDIRYVQTILKLTELMNNLQLLFNTSSAVH